MRKKADLHVHTMHSGIGHLGMLRFPESVDRPGDVVDAARVKGLDVLCIADHDCIEGALAAKEYAERFDDIEVIVGEEVTTAEGEILGLWLTELVPPGLSAEETIRRIRAQDGIVIAPHPFSFHVSALNEKILDLDIDGIEVVNGGHVDGYSNMMAREVSKKYPGKWAEISSSDAHSVSTMGYAWTEFEGDNAESLRKAILEKRTVPCGNPCPADRWVAWSMISVFKALKMIVRSMFGLLKPDPNDPLVTAILNISGHKKLPSVLGAIIYLFPPVPYLAYIASNEWLKKRARRLRNRLSETLEKIVSNHR